jgi:eukaryotic-like serine/threonine-protein kinase
MHTGQVVNERYALEEPIGRGGMAEVWRAHDNRLNRTVAIKFLAPGAKENPEFLARLFNEARSVASISHPHVTGVLDYGTTDDGPYLVMEYVPGGSLSDLTGDPLPAERAIEIVRQVASGAGAAHARGVVHRDIKPGNILLCDDGSVKLADFGIALSSKALTKLTATGAAIGSPHYISPEQAMGERATPRSDVYSMGVVLYELLTGVLPFDGGNATAIAISHVDAAPPPPSSVEAGLDPRLEAIVMRCLDKQPEARFENGDELAVALAAEQVGAALVPAEVEQVTAELGAALGTPTPPRARSVIVKRTVGALTLVVLLVGIGIHLTASPSVAEPDRPRHPGVKKTHSPPRSKSSPVGSTTSTAPSMAASPTPTPTPTRTERSHPVVRPSRPAPSPTNKPKPRPTGTPSPTATPSPSPTPAPSPTPTTAVPTTLS